MVAFTMPIKMMHDSGPAHQPASDHADRGDIRRNVACERRGGGGQTDRNGTCSALPLLSVIVIAGMLSFFSSPSFFS